MQILLFWNDTSANQFVKFSIDYTIEEDFLSVFDVQPIEVSLLSHNSQTVVTRMKVREPEVFNTLRTRFLNANCLDSLIEKIADHHQLALVLPSNKY